VKEQYLIELSNATLTNIKDRQAKNPDLTITMNRSDLNAMMAAQADLNSLISAGRVKLDGNVAVLAELRSVVVDFNPAFQIMPGTFLGQTVADSAQANPFKQPEPELSAE